MTIIPYVNDIRQYVKDNPNSAQLCQYNNNNVQNDFYLSLVMELDTKINDIGTSGTMIIEDYNMYSNIDGSKTICDKEVEKIIKKYIAKYRDNIQDDFVDYFTHMSQLQDDMKKYSANIIKNNIVNTL